MTFANLLPEDFKRKLLYRKVMIRWATICGLTLFCTGVVLAGKLLAHRSANMRLTFRETQASPLKEVSAENDRMKGRLSELEERESLLGKFEREHNPLVLIGIVSQAAKSTESRIQIQEFRLDSVTITPPSPSTPVRSRSVEQKADQVVTPDETEHTSLSLKGIARDDLAVAQFINRLERSEVFEVVNLSSSIGTKLETGPAREFIVECIY